MKVECPKCHKQMSKIYVKIDDLIYRILEGVYFCDNCDIMTKPKFEEINWK